MTPRTVFPPRRAELAAWAAAAACAGLAVLGWRSAADASPPPAPPVRATYGIVRPVTGDSVVRAASYIAEHNPFRLDRRPAAVPFGAAADVAPPPPVEAPPKPVLTLKGVVGGPPWEALLEGVPGRPGLTIVRSGDTLGGLTVRSVRRDTVVVRGMDTTWTLTVRRVWQ